MSKISFGTDGWRAVMCEDFIFSNVRLVSQAICNYVKAKEDPKKGLVIGYDTRFFSDKFALAAATVCAANGIPVYLTSEDAPTPVVAFSVKDRKTAGAIMFTASHNPSIYNGMKFIPYYAGPAMPDITGVIEQEISRITEKDINMMPAEEAEKQNLITRFDPSALYIKQINSIINLNAIKKGKLKIILDPLFATGRKYLKSILAQVCDAQMIHGEPDPSFGGLNPEPIGVNLVPLTEAVKGKAHLGLATDGDADRFGVVDFDGTYINANQVLSLLLVHLIKNYKWKGPVARTVATTHLLDRIAKANDMEVFEYPVGFKYIGEAIRDKGCIIGGEESGGVSIKGHIPEKDGILAVSLIAEMRAMEGKSLGVLYNDIMKKYGHAYSQRVDIHAPDELKKKVFGELEKNPWQKVAGKKVEKIERIDGVKFILEDGSWILMRPSGTEPIVRVYSEASSPEEMAKISQEGVSLFSVQEVKA